MADRDSGVFLEEHHRQRFTYHVTTRNNDRAPPIQWRPRPLQNLHDSGGSRGQEARQTKEEITGTARTDAIDILLCYDRIGNHLLREMAGQGHLHDDPARSPISVELPQHHLQFHGRGTSWHLLETRCHTHVFGSAQNSLTIHTGGGITTHAQRL